MRRLFLLLALWGLFGCTPETVHVPATQLVVRVSADAALRSSLSSLRLRTAGPSGARWALRKETSFAAEELRWPVELVLVPSREADSEAAFEVIVDALDDDGASLSQIRARVRFALRKARVLDLALAVCGKSRVCGDAEQCFGPDCETCIAAACVPTPSFDPEDLPAYPDDAAASDGGSVSEPDAAADKDAAASDAGVMDADARDRPSDAAALDEASSDTGSVDAAPADASGCVGTACDDAGSADADTGVGPEAGPACTSADDSCESDSVRACNAQGTGFTLTACAVGCAATPAPHCTRLYPAAPVVEQDLAPGGLAEIIVPSGVTLLNTDTGAISGGVTRAANTVNTKREVIAGIAFHQTADGHGVFSFAKLSVDSGATLKLIGASGAVLVAADAIVVRGVIDARPMDASGVLCPAARVAGPGAARGGAAGTLTCCPTYTAPTAGEGTGGGGAGVNIMGGSSSGGGGGHGAAGGKGRGGCSQNMPAYAGGSAGSLYGSGIEGGSGGGGGASSDGGGGGGKVRLVAGLVITIGDGSAISGINAGGCGGKGGGAAGGGGSGGGIVLEAPFVQVSAKGTLAANGGAGGGYLNTTSTDGQPGQLSAAAALAPGNTVSSVGEGNGGASDAPAGRDVVTNGCTSIAVSGGGGAAGLIQIRSPHPGVNAQAVLSPSIASGKAQVVTADVR